MNIRISNKIVRQSFRHNFSRYLSLQDINRNTSPINFHKNFENRSTHFPFSNRSLHKALCHAPAPLYLNFQRNISQKASEIKDPLAPLEKNVKTEELVTDPYESLADSLHVGANKIDGSSVLEILQQIKELGIDGLAENLLVTIQETYGLPWWASISFAALMMRITFSLPFNLNLMRMMSKIEEAEHELVPIVKDMNRKAETRPEIGDTLTFGNKKYRTAVNDECRKVFLRKGDPSAVIGIAIFQSLPWLAYTSALHKLCSEPSDSINNTYQIYDQMVEGGFGWVTNLTEYDPYFILPAAYGLTNFLIIVIQQEGRSNPSSAFNKVIFNSFKTLSVTLFAISTVQPAGVTIYWLTSSMYGLVQALVLNTTVVRRLLRVPKFDPDIEATLPQLPTGEKKQRLLIRSGKKAYIDNK